MRRNLRSLIMAGSLGLATVVTFSGCAGKGDRSTGQYSDDRATARKVQSELNRNPIYKFEDVNVSAYRGVVQLSGWVEKSEQKQIAENVARHVPGVVQVVNNLTFKPRFDLVTPTGESQTGRPVSEEQQQRSQQPQPLPESRQ